VPRSVQDALRDFRPAGWRRERQGKILESTASDRDDAVADGVKRLDRGAAGLAAVLSISGGIAVDQDGLATRLVPLRPCKRVTSPPPVEWADEHDVRRSSASMTVARSSE